MYLIDTDILIYNLKGHEKVQENFRKRAEEKKVISVISYGELYFGAMKSKFSTKNLANVKRIGELFKIISLDKDIIEIYGDLKLKMQEKGNVVDDFDLLIASTALYLNFVLVTNNEKHFKKIPGLKIENWAGALMS